MPAAATMTTSSTTSGELAKPQSGTFAPVSDAALRDQTTAPSRRRARSGFRSHRTCRRDRRSRVGVARGPAPAFDSQNRAASRCVHTGSPVVSVVAGDDLVVAALLLGVEEVAAGPRRTTSPVRSAGATARPAATATSRSRSARRERCRRARVRESRAIRLASTRGGLVTAPQRAGLRLARSSASPGGSIFSAAGAAARCRSRCRRAVVWDRSRQPELPASPLGWLAGLGQEPFLGSLRPPPVELRAGLAGDATGPDERPHSAREQDGRDHRRAPRSVGEATAGHRPGDEGEAQDRDGEDGEERPHRLVHRLVDASAARGHDVIRTTAPRRSDQGARLKNSHHTTIAAADEAPPSSPTECRSGARTALTPRSGTRH